MKPKYPFDYVGANDLTKEQIARMEQVREAFRVLYKTLFEPAPEIATGFAGTDKVLVTDGRDKAIVVHLLEDSCMRSIRAICFEE